MPSPALVQRIDALRRCEAMLCSPDEGGLSVFEGAPGVGKSTLIEAACTMAAARGLTVARAIGSGLEREVAYGVVRQLFESLHAAQRRGRRRRALPPLEGRGDGGDHDLRHSPLRALAERAAESPVLLAVDDLDLADQPSLEFLRYLTQRRTQRAGAAVAGPTPAGSGRGHPPISLLHVQQAAEIVRLEPFDAAGVAELLRARGRAPAPELCEELLRLTGGNPFLLASLVDGFALDRTDEVPPAVIRQLALRLDRLA